MRHNAWWVVSAMMGDEGRRNIQYTDITIITNWIGDQTAWVLVTKKRENPEYGSLMKSFVLRYEEAQKSANTAK